MMSTKHEPIVTAARSAMFTCKSAHSRLIRLLLFTVLAGSVAAFACEVAYVLLGSNFHVVVDGKCYRSAQPSLSDLQHFVERYGIRTVVNLRGENEDEEWYHAEKRRTHELGAVHLDVGLFGRHPPYEDDLQNLVKALDNAAQPMLLHCQSGGDRAGMAATAFLLLRSDTSLEEAREQLSLRFGHNPFGNAACQGRLFDCYARWLGEQNLVHSPERFRTWACKHYRRAQVINACDFNRPAVFHEPPLARFD